jgi:hypothetical protein
MIVRDEAASLARAIGSFAGLADEVVVVDTGSTDGTQDLARLMGAKVVEHAWRDDFSAARNAGFDACKCDWVFGLDADERLLPESRDELQRLIEGGTAQAYFVTRRDLAAEGFSEMSFVRLGRRDLNRRMVGRIHERFDPPLTNVARSGILLEHDGYLPERKVARLRRNVRLLELELRERPGRPYYLADLTHLYWLLGDLRWKSTFAKTMAAVDLDAPRSPLSLAIPLLEIVLGTPAADLPPGVDHAGAETLAERWYPKSVPLLVARARLAYGRGDLALAAELGERAVVLWDTGNYDRTISFDPVVVGPELRLNLGVALGNVGRFDEATRRLEEAAADPRFAELAERNIAAIRSHLNSR